MERNAVPSLSMSLPDLIEKTSKSEDTHQQTGEQRAWLYMTAAYSGLRASELGSLTPEEFPLGRCLAIHRSSRKKDEE